MGIDGRERIREFIRNSKVPVEAKLDNFSVYANRQSINRFLALHELFKLQLPVKGSIVECGVFLGQSLFTFAHFSSIYEPSNYRRQVVGFDTFDGFPNWSIKDNLDESKGIFKPPYPSYDELESARQAFQGNHYLESEEKIQLVKGDALTTMPEFIEKNKHFICSMLYLDFDLYEPTKLALEIFVPRMPKGALLVFDELNHPDWPGETQAAMEIMGIRNLELRNFPFNPNLSFAVI